MSASSTDRSRRRSPSRAASAATPTPSGASNGRAARRPRPAEDTPAVRAILQGAVEEAARLLGADGAFLYLLRPGTDRLRLTHDSGIRDLRDRTWVRRLEVRVGTGLFGKAVAERRVIVTGDYPADRTFRHAPGPDRIVRTVGIRSLVVAPMIAGDEAYGALGTFSREVEAFTAPQIALVRSLAEHAAQAIANARLIDELASSREELARRAELEQALRELGARIGAASDPADVVQAAVDEALRLIHGEGARIDLVDPTLGLLRGSYTSGAEPPTPTQWPDDPDETLDEGISGKVVTEGRSFWTGSYLDDDRFKHAYGPDTYARATGIRSAIAAPLVGEHGPFGALTVWSRAANAFGGEQAGVLEIIAGQAAVALGRARLIEQLDRSRDALARRADEERTLREIAARLSAVGDPAEVLQRIVGEVRRLLGAERCRLDLVEPMSGRVLWSDPPDMLLHDVAAIPLGDATQARGLTAIAIAERRALVSPDYLADTRFGHYPEADREAVELGLTSVVVVPVIGEAGLLGVLQAAHQKPAAFGDDEVRLVEALASQAAIAITNARLIDRLETSQAAIERTAHAERALREIAARIAVLHDPAEVLDSIIAEAPRLVGADWALIDTVEPTSGRVQWTWPASLSDPARTTAGIADVRSGRRPSKGLSGKAIARGRAVISTDYLADESFAHSSASDAYAATIGMRAVIAAPLVGEKGLLGILQVGSRREGAFGAEDASRIEVLANQAAVALTNARLIEELDRSREDLAHTARAERTLRELAGRLTAIRDPRALLQDVTRAAAALLGSTAAIIDLVDPGTDAFTWGFDVGVERGLRDRWYAEGLGDPASRLAMAERRAIITGNYGADPRFDATDHAAFLDDIGLCSLVAVPLVTEQAVLGTLAVLSDRPDAFDEDAAALLQALADQASIAVANARLIEELDRSRDALRRTADAERTLREITAGLTAIAEPREVLQRIVDAARRLARSDVSYLDLLDPSTAGLRFEVWSGEMGETIGRHFQGEYQPTDGIAALAIAERRAIRSGDYLADDRYTPPPAGVAAADATGLRAIVATPLVAEGMVLGVLTVASTRPDAFDEEDEHQLGALADQAAIALRNAELVRALGQSREETARRAETERTLREIAARITAIRDPEGILELIVDEARRVLGSDGAHLTRLDEGGTLLRPVVVAGETDETAAWIRTLEFPVDGGINGLAAGLGRVVWTPDYAMDPRIPREPEDLAVAERLRLAAMAAAPLRAPGGEVIGTLSVSYARPGPIPSDRLEVLQALADHAAIALSNADLYQRVESSEARYRRLVQATPDVIWQNDADGRFTFIADSAEQLFGWPAAELVGEHFAKIVAPEAMDDAGRAWAVLGAGGEQHWRLRFVLRRRDGTTFPAEVSAVSIFADGRFEGGQGTLRDISERERLEAELRQSEARYRFLVENMPDVIWALDVEGRFTYISESVETATGWPPSALIGRHFSEFTTAGTLPRVEGMIPSLEADPHTPRVVRIEVPRRDGGVLPTELSFVGRIQDGKLVGVQGVSRDITERERLEAELRDSEERYRSLVQSSPDLIFTMDGEGRYTFFSDRSEEVVGWRPEELIGRPFAEFVDMGAFPNAAAEFARFAAEPGRPTTNRLGFRHRDGRVIPFEVSALGHVEDGRLVAVRGVARDISERERLERELRESEERYRFLVENSPDIVFSADVAGRFTYVSESIEKILGWTPAEITGRRFSDIIRYESPEDVGRRWAVIAQDPSREITARFELLDRAGNARPFEVSAVGIVRDGGFAGLHGSARDVAERERLERELRDSEGRYRFLVQSSPDMIWVTDADGRFTFVSDTTAAILGLAPEEIVGRSFEDLTTPAVRRTARAMFRFLARRPTVAHRSRLPVRTADGRELMVEISGIAMQIDGKFAGAHGTARDVSERDRLERDLRRQAGELAAGEERAHLARELHDSVTQALFSMTLLSRSIEMLLERDPAQVPEKLGALRELQRDALAEMRALIFELRPGNVAEHGLIAALRTHAAGLSGRVGLPVVVEGSLGDRPAIEVEETLYRIAQEALHNVVKHAGARDVRIEVSPTADGVRLVVRDDGRGFDPDRVPAGHLGLAGMRARAERLGGALEIRSAPGAGTTVEAILPPVPRGAATAADVPA